MIERLPRPRILFEGVPDEVFEAMKAFAPTYKRIDIDHPVDDIHPTDWDLLISYSDEPFRSWIPHTLAFGSSRISSYFRSSTVPAAELDIPTGPGIEIRQLVLSTVIPEVPPPPRTIWSKKSGSWGPSKLQPDDLGNGFPLLTVGEESYVMAFWSISVSSPNTHTLVLPEKTRNPEAWLQVLLARLQQDDPEHFPPGPEWRESSRWAPPELRYAYDEVDRLERERANALEALEARLTEARSSVERQRTLAEKGWWRLLTASGDSLASCVKEALEQLGFIVEDRDATTEGAKLEDLRVTDPDAPDWVCLAEVKGYAKGAKSNDVTQVAMNPAVKFAVETGRAPDKLWHIVNAKKETPPDRRGRTFSDPESVLANFATQGGLVLDTRDLAQALFAIIDGSIVPSDLRANLREAVGLWTWPIS